MALGIQYAMHMHYIACGLTYSTIFSILSHKRHDFRAEKLFNIKQVLPVSVRHTVKNALKNIINGKPIRLRQYLDFKSY
jgi:uncharacterized BrkB/YihY/UPF0761 family membrane protein